MPDPTPGAVLSGTPTPVPDTNNLPGNSAPVPPAPTNAQSSPTGQGPSPDMVHHSVLGRAIKSLVGAIHGNETQYRPNAHGGVDEVQAPAKPGSVFRQLLAGALIGGAVGSQPETSGKDGEGRRSTGGILSGFARGGAAVAQASQLQNQNAFNKAKEQLSLSHDAQREQDEHMLRQANIAHLHANTLSLQHNLHALDEENLEKKNTASRVLIKTMTDAGATPAQISIDGKPLDTIPATDLAAEFRRNPGMLNGPPGAHRVFIDTTDAGELHWDGKTWRDDSGNVPNMAQHSTVRAFDVPANTMKSPTSVSGAVINQLRGASITDPTKSYAISPEGLSSLYSLNLGDMTKKSLANQRDANAKKQNPQASATGSSRVAGSDFVFKGRRYSGRAVDLVEGDMDPSQLSKRSKDYNEKLDEARAYSLARYNKPFDLAKAQSDFKFANNPSTQNTLKYLNSLTGSDNKSGNLGELVTLSNNIKRTDFPALNDAAAWARIQAGDAQMASYYGAVTEVSDQVAKIMQGGGTSSGTSDAKLKQAQELFNKGFSKDQIGAVAQTLRNLLANRKNELIGDNRYLRKQYGQTAPQGLTNQGPTSSTHRFSLSAWQQANPGGDANAAKAAAQKAGYEIVQ